MNDVKREAAAAGGDSPASSAGGAEGKRKVAIITGITGQYGCQNCKNQGIENTAKRFITANFQACLLRQ